MVSVECFTFLLVCENYAALHVKTLVLDTQYDLHTNHVQGH